MKEIKLFYYRYFKVLTKVQALELGLEFTSNIHGDAIIALNCRSLWKDSKDRIYRVRELIQKQDQ